ncbi:MAG: FAD-dependent oxidoreductase, partial [Pseudomonadota bacterium]|nr:FAD-dependent oxidoreductase [Pseudomonadota bacterium]
TILHVKGGGTVPSGEGRRRIVIGEDLVDREGYFARRFDASPGATYLVRPDQHLAARWRETQDATVAAASMRLRGFGR